MFLTSTKKTAADGSTPGRPPPGDQLSDSLQGDSIGGRAAMPIAGLVQRIGSSASGGGGPAGVGAGEVRALANEGTAAGGGSLPHGATLQKAFGPEHDLSDVTGHVGGAAADACDAINADAFATGTKTAYKEQPDLWTAAHETTHVVQQRAGVSLLGGVGAENDPYEQQADAVADRVVAGVSAADLLPAAAGGGVSQAAPVQAMFSGGLKERLYADIRGELVKRYANVPAQWRINQLAKDAAEYSTIEEVAEELGLKPLGNDQVARAEPSAQSPAQPSAQQVPQQPSAEPTAKPLAQQSPAQPTPKQAQAAPPTPKPPAEPTARPQTQASAQPSTQQPTAKPKPATGPAPSLPAQSQAAVGQGQKPASESAPKPAKPSKADRLFVTHRRGVCYLDELMGEDTVQDLTRMYTPEGKEVYIAKANMEGAMNDYSFTLNPPKKAKKPYDTAKPVPAKQGLSQMFTCCDCGQLADAANDCDWVVHDKAMGGCGYANIIANGDAHSRNNEAFKNAMKGLRHDSTAKQILQTLAAHPKAAAFWGLDHIDTVINTVGAWATLKESAMFVNEDLAGFAAAMDHVAK